MREVWAASNVKMSLKIILIYLHPILYVYYIVCYEILWYQYI